MKRKKWKKCDLNENENDVLDLPSLEIVTFGGFSFAYCHVAVFESMWWLFIFISFLILDLPKLHTISFDDYGYAFQGDYGEGSFECTADLQATSTFPFHFISTF